MKNIKILTAVVFSSLSSLAFAQDITGTWKNIDDKTGSSKAILEIRQESNGTFTAKVIKITPRIIIKEKFGKSVNIQSLFTSWFFTEAMLAAAISRS